MGQLGFLNFFQAHTLGEDDQIGWLRVKLARVKNTQDSHSRVPPCTPLFRCCSPTPSDTHPRSARRTRPPSGTTLPAQATRRIWAPPHLQRGSAAEWGV